MGFSRVDVSGTFGHGASFFSLSQAVCLHTARCTLSNTFVNVIF